MPDKRMTDQGGGEKPVGGVSRRDFLKRSATAGTATVAGLAALGVPWERELDSRDAFAAQNYSDAESKQVEDRLRALGYLE